MRAYERASVCVWTHSCVTICMFIFDVSVESQSGASATGQYRLLWCVFPEENIQGEDGSPVVLFGQVLYLLSIEPL